MADSATSTKAPTTPSGSTPPGNAPDQPFESALRGYDRRQVEDFVRAKKKEIAALTAELAEATRQRRLAAEQVEATEKELRELRERASQNDAAPVGDGFGFRAEKLLRLAEQEASEIRASAGQESAAVIEEARSQAEQHRHEVERDLIARKSQIEQQAAQRNAELHDREKQIAEQLTSAREQADQLHASASRAADRLRQESEAAAAETRARAAADADRERDQARQEIARLDGLQGDVRGELGRLARSLITELGATVPPELVVEAGPETDPDHAGSADA